MTSRYGPTNPVSATNGGRPSDRPLLLALPPPLLLASLWTPRDLALLHLSSIGYVLVQPASMPYAYHAAAGGVDVEDGVEILLGFCSPWRFGSFCLRGEALASTDLILVSSRRLGAISSMTSGFAILLSRSRTLRRQHGRLDALHLVVAA